MKVWLISIFEQTPVDNVYSTRFQSIANLALEKGHDVKFFSSTFKHNTKNQRFSTTTKVQKDYELTFVKSIAYKANISPKRLLSHYVLAFDLLRQLKKEEVPDIILIAFPPVTIPYKVIKWAKRNHIPVILDVIDPWPDVFYKAIPDKLKFFGKIALLPLEYRLRFILKNVNAITAISNEYIQWAKTYSIIKNSKVFYPAADFAVLNTKIQNAKVPNKGQTLNVVYAGSLASSYDIGCILNAARYLSEQKANVQFYIAGAGEQEAQIKKHQENYQNVNFVGRLNKDDLLDLYAKCDLGMTQHIKGATQSVTYKLFDLLSCELPILNSLESEMKEIILNNKVGLHNSPGDFKQLAENILFFIQNPKSLLEYKQNAIELAQNSGDSVKLYGAFVDYIEEFVK